MTAKVISLHMLASKGMDDTQPIGLGVYMI
jgi:hypothetical protein